MDRDAEPQEEAGLLPRGLAFKSGRISGRPEEMGAFALHIAGTDEAGTPIPPNDFALKVGRAEVDEIRVATSQLGVARRGEPYVHELAAEGGSNREIAQTLYVTPKTVEVHLSNAYRKLGIRSRRGLPAALG